MSAQGAPASSLRLIGQQLGAIDLLPLVPADERALVVMHRQLSEGVNAQTAQVFPRVVLDYVWLGVTLATIWGSIAVIAGAILLR